MIAKSQDDFEYRIARLRLDANDVLVVKASNPIPDVVSRRIQERVRYILGEHTKVLVIDSGLDISVLTSAEIEKRSAPIPFLANTATPAMDVA